MNNIVHMITYLLLGESKDSAVHKLSFADSTFDSVGFIKGIR